MEISLKNPKTIAFAALCFVLACAIFFLVSRETTKPIFVPSDNIQKVSATTETEDPSTLVGIKDPNAPQVIKGKLVMDIFGPSATTQVSVKTKYSCVDSAGIQKNWGYRTLRTLNEEETIAAVRADLVCSLSVIGIEPQIVEGKQWDTPTLDDPLYYVYGGVKNQLLKINIRQK
jgi:hypothetical protein